MLYLYRYNTQPALPDFITKPAIPVPPGKELGTAIKMKNDIQNDTTFIWQYFNTYGINL